MNLQAIKPGAPRSVLLIVGGLMWSGVGIMLTRHATGWLQAIDGSQRITYILAGMAAAGVIQVLFTRLAKKNISRVNNLGERPCIFAFQAWTSYPLIAFMIALGIILRHSPLPKPILAILYTGIGGGLLLASLCYYQHVFTTERLSMVS